MITTFDRDRLARNLPDAYRKGGESNNCKILAIEKTVADSLRADIAAVYDCLDLDMAVGSTLDMYGAMLGQARDAATDERYRAMIRAKIFRDHCLASYDNIVYAIAQTFGCNIKEFALHEGASPCIVSIADVPYTILDANAISQPDAIETMRKLLPVGVRLAGVGFVSSADGTIRATGRITGQGGTVTLTQRDQ